MNKIAPQEARSRPAARLHELIDNITIAMLVTVTPHGALRSRPMFTQEMKEPGELWFLTSDETGVAHDIELEPAVNVAYADPEKQSYVSVSGLATIIHERGKQKEFWREEYRRYFPNGLDDPHLALLRVRIESAEYWDVASRQMQPVEPLKGARNGGTGSAPDEAGDSEKTATLEGEEHVKVEVRAARASG